MSEPPSVRRAPPSPLVFSPETVLPPAPPLSNNNSSHGSGSNTVSMPFVRRHVTRRLKAAKAECDKELQRVTNNITAFFEERLRDGDHEREVDRECRERERERERDRDRDSQLGDPESIREALLCHAGESRPPSQAVSMDDACSDGGYEAELETSRHSRQLSSSSGPATLRRQNTLPWDKQLAQTASSSTASIIPIPSVGDTASPPRKQTNASIAPPLWSSQGISRRLSRAIHIPSRPVRSGQSSRSTSRSRSPLPPNSNHNSFSDSYNSGPPPHSSPSNHRSSRILVDDPIDPIMTVLYDIIGVATDIIDMSITQLTAQPKVCEALVQRVQNIGKAWDEHPDWHGRHWYVQVLLAVASLSRVVEWWEAEKAFWNFDDNDDEQDEPLTFVMKPAEDSVIPPAPTPTFRQQEEEGSSLSFTTDDENKLRLTRPMSQTRKSRDEVPKDLTMSRPREEAHPSGSNKLMESARVLATERLRLQAETAQNQNIVLELSLDGDHFIWVNYAWRVVVGTDPDGLPGTRISQLLLPADWGVFRDATQRLQNDDSHTVEVIFRLQVEPEDDHEVSSGTLYQQMEGKGMLMIDREDGQPSHTMWVVKPMASPRYEYTSPSIMLESGEVGDDPASAEAASTSFADRSGLEPVTPFPFSLPISTELLLCRICESQIPQWYFEKHSETCVEVHRLEAEIAECNESISELRNTIRELCITVDKASPTIMAEYRGMPIISPSTSPGSSSPLQLFRVNKIQRIGAKKVQRRLLEQLEDILLVASEVSMPSLKEEESKEPIERQRLLSPSSESKMSQVRNWNKPSTQDAALTQLVEDAERVMRQKIDNVVRMQNTIRYSEKIWHEWEERVEQELAREDGEEDSDESSDDNDNLPVEEDPADDHSSTKSRYLLTGDAPSLDPTPMASSSHSIAPSKSHSSVLLPMTPVDSSSATSSPTPTPALFSPSHPLPLPPTNAPTPTLWQVLTKMPTRSSTPSSISSPLALAAPIVASSDDAPPPMNLNDGPNTGSLMIKTKRSAGNLLDPAIQITPPTSPMLSPHDGAPLRRGHRRHSTAANVILSPMTAASGAPMSPRQSSAAPVSRANPTSIKDFEVIKPISKGAFGSVFLAKKRVTGDYYAIKVLKKADMIAKNQITNVKAERMILMKQAESPFVAKLYFTFQSKENLYLVMEYLNGGDCAALIKSLGSLPEEWAKNYVAEVVLGLEYLHQRGVVHRDLKPDNLLIDQHGHLKLTDFGLSRIGLLGRQTRESQISIRPRPRHDSRSRPPSIDSAYLASPLLSADLLAGDDVSESSGSESLSAFFPRRSLSKAESPLQSFATELTNDLRSHSGLGTPPGEQKFVGTPDYLAPETILGLRGDDAGVDWWALGVVTYEFLYGIPPFHAETPEKVFENILSGHIEWHEDWIEFSDEARDFMQGLMTLNTNERLGARGAEEVKNHPFFHDIDWDKVTSTEAAFIPQITDPESTDYFDPRGAIPQLFHDDDQIAITSQVVYESPDAAPSGPTPPGTLPVQISSQREGGSSGGDDFGSFSFKNLPVLKQANDDVIRKLKTDQLVPITHALSDSTSQHTRKRSLSQRIKKPPSVNTTMDHKTTSTNPPSPATSTSSVASSPSRTGLLSSAPGSVSSHTRKPSEFGAVERFKLNHFDGVERRNSMPSRLRTGSVSSAGDGSGSENWPSSVGHGSQFDASTPPSSVHSIDLRKGPDPSDRAVTCLLAEDNPITAKMIETLLIRLGCRCVVVSDGSEAISVAMGDIKFDCILMDLHMPVLDGEGAARYIKSTNSKNTSTPIIAVSAYSGIDTNEASNVFFASLSKPLQKADLLVVMRQLGFKTSTIPGGPGATKLTAARVLP